MFELCVACAFLLLCDIDIGLHDCMSSGHCFWEKTSNGCKDEDDTFTHNAYDFYELCRAGERKGARFNCEEAPAKLSEGKCKDRDTPNKDLSERSSGKNHKSKKKYCFDCVNSTCINQCCILVRSFCRLADDGRLV